LVGIGIALTWPGLLFPATYHMHFVQSSLDMMYSGASFAILCSIGTTIATVSPLFWTTFCFSSLHTICKGVDFIIGTSSADVVSDDSSFSFIYFCKGGVAPPVPTVPVHHGLDVSDFRSVLLPASWLVPGISFLVVHTSDAIAEVSPYNMVPSFCGSAVSIPSVMGLSGADAASLSIAFIFLFFVSFLLVAQATIFLVQEILLSTLIMLDRPSMTQG